MFKRNVAVSGFQIGHFIGIADGIAVTTGTPACKRLLDGTAGTLTNAASYDATAGVWKIDLAAGDMDASLVGLSFTLAACLPISYTIKTDTKLVSDLNDTGGTAQTGDAFARIGAAGAGLTAVPWNAAWDAEVQSEAADALNAYDPPTNAEMEARTLPTASYFDPATDTVVPSGGTINSVLGSVGSVSGLTPAAIGAEVWTGEYSRVIDEVGTVTGNVDGNVGGSVGSVGSVSNVLAIGGVTMAEGSIPGVVAGQTGGLALYGSAGLTAQETADAVNNLAPAGASGAAGSIRAEIDSILNGLTGIGIIPLVYTVTEPGGVIPISGVTVELYTEEACLNCIRRGVTNAFGVVTFWLTTVGTYWIKSAKDGYQFDLDSEAVSV